MIEQIPLNPSQEQDFQLIYNNLIYTFELRWNDFQNYWYLNIKDDADVYKISGIKLVINNNIFRYLTYISLGGMVLYDTTPESTTPLDPFNDLGGRLQLYRQI